MNPKPRAVIGYPGTIRRVQQGKFPRKPNNKSLFDQARSVKMAGYLASFFFSRVCGPRLRLGP